MTVGLSTGIAFAALAFSFVSPLFSVFAQHKIRRMELDFELEKQSRDFYDRHRAEVIERYITAAGRACKLRGGTNLADFGASMGEIYLYTAPELWPLLDRITEKLDKHEQELPLGELQELCKALAASSAPVRKKYDRDKP